MVRMERNSKLSRNLMFLTRPELWPHWPFLPLVRRHQHKEEEYGVLFDALKASELTGYSSTVFLTNLYLMPPKLDDFLEMPRETYDTPEEIVQAGWSVD